MLSREMMGVLALAIVWVNTLLVLGAALRELAVLLKLRQSGPWSGVVVSGAGPGGAIAEDRVEQVGRWAADDADRRAVAFSDRSYAGVVHGGEVRLDDGRIVLVEVAAEADVWPPPDARALAAASPSPEAFDASWRDAKKPRGFVRTVTTSIREQARVWLGGELVQDAGGWRLAPAREGGVLVAAVDPRAFATGKARLCAAFLAGVIAAAAACTALSLTRPHFGTISTVGGALSLAYFLLVQPAGTALRAAVLTPSRAALRGNWVDPGGSRSETAHPAAEPQS